MSNKHIKSIDIIGKKENVNQKHNEESLNHKDG
jgi:hypothetical protein